VRRGDVAELPATGGYALAIHGDILAFSADRPTPGASVGVDVPFGGAADVVGLVPDEPEAPGRPPVWPTSIATPAAGRIAVDVSAGPVRITPR
jgi:hypothetical protein